MEMFCIYDETCAHSVTILNLNIFTVTWTPILLVLHVDLPYMLLFLSFQLYRLQDSILWFHLYGGLVTHTVIPWYIIK